LSEVSYLLEMDWVRKNRWLIIVLPLVGVLAISASFMRSPEIPVRVGSVERGAITNTISTNGKIEPIDNFEARAVAPSPVQRVHVKEGDSVHAGQLLVQLDDATARAQAAKARTQLRAAESDLAAIRKGGSQDEVLQTQANLVKARSERDSAERNLAAVRKLQERGSASVGEVQEAENRLKRAQAEVTLLEQRQTGRYSNPEVARVQAQAEEARANLNAAEEVLRQSNIVAPRAGIVYSLPVREGAFVNPGDLIVQVADLGKMQVRAFVDEPEIGKLNPGQKVTISWDAIPGRAWEGTVTRVPSTVILRGTRNVGEVVAAVDNGDRKLLPNTNVSVLITTLKQDDALTVSREAVYQDQGKRYVYRVQDGQLRRTDVETAISNLTRIQVTKGLSEGTRVALGSVNGQPLSDGSPVKIVE
jgi:HlyD family secretion protein